MENLIKEYEIDYVEIYTPMAKLLAHWHQQVLGFKIEGIYNSTDISDNKISFVLRSGTIRLILTSTFPSLIQSEKNEEVTKFINKQHCGVKRIALSTPDVNASFKKAVENGGIIQQLPLTIKGAEGEITEASIKLYDDNEILFVDRKSYLGYFKPGYRKMETLNEEDSSMFSCIDHVASELRVGETDFWTNYLTKTIGTSLVQSINKSEDNKTGMTLNINQSNNKKLTFVMAEPDGTGVSSKVLENINKFGPGIHHLAFLTDDIVSTIKKIENSNVEFVNFPPAYYTLLRQNSEMKNIDIDTLEKYGILIDKEGDTFLYQKFIKPYGDRPFFFYEIVQRVNGYSGFALKNINVLKKAEEYDIMTPKN
jgi:4-hydroxyphenylpyruvate dioxygenase